MSATPFPLPRRLPGGALLYSLLLCGSLLLGISQVSAAPVHALTVYGEAPKYAADFQHFDYV
ncbi:MAG: hypothetical protein WBZ57_06055, partial [Pseudomonas graminis]